ncbi:right-handed parallel beta-helix repeat-containing protein [Brachybacterium sp. ACRRE]|uniref:right-handed parallel beta-helix repeat-containing protein n=1 Tax=Brachybacterium sp. ACRRE TaxID=2918184 RepID=UPI001EF1A942|nr:right-handed parallel beta-helix repeat-containing protein [Brachybacterium sp. ACRRE]MCG7311049.1 right-handed parallel beta-helix repeat-containing protein [Brachybacterium sp. ACRRE]
MPQSRPSRWMVGALTLVAAAALAAPAHAASHDTRPAPAAQVSSAAPAHGSVGPRTSDGAVPGTTAWEHSRRDHGSAGRASRAIHVDCSASTNGDGSARAPLNSLEAAGARTLSAGDHLLLRRGTTCEGTLTLTGRGTTKAPIVVGAYGHGTARAHVEGDGAASAVHLQNMEHVVLQDLEVTNSTDPGTARRGVLVSLADTGTRSGFELRNLDIHDVLGDDAKGPDGSQGLAFRVTGSTPSAFDDVRIHDNSIRHVDRQAMVVVLSDFTCRAEIGCTDPEDWTPSTRVKIERNLIEDAGGDGIVANTTQGALLQDNVVRGFNVRSKEYNAGLWTFNSDDALAQYNEASGGKGHLDGMAYDIDGATVDNTFQYNYSHDNEGGFFLLCTHEDRQRGSLVQYNVSQNDQYRGVENCVDEIESALIRNNTISVGEGVTQTLVNENTESLRNVRFEGNIVSASEGGSIDMNLASATGYTFSGNVLHGVAGAPEDPTGSTADPLLCDPGTAQDAFDVARAYRVDRHSPARGLAPSVERGLRDYSGKRVHHRAPTAGALEAPRRC